MQALNNLPLKRKLLLVTFATCLAALAIACSALFWFQSTTFRDGFIAELESLGAMIAHNSAAPLTFDDKKSGVEILSALKVKPHITSARIFDGDGKLFASFGSEENLPVKVDVKAESSSKFDGGYALVSLPIPLEGTQAGRLELRAEFASQYRTLLSLYAGVMAVVLVGSLVVILVITSALQRIITGPIFALADVARNISEREDYSTRAQENGKDEVGTLTRTFNRMLDQIQSRDTKLRQVNASLESEIVERKQAQAIQARLTAIIEATPDFVGSSDPSGRVLYMNYAGRAMIGRGEHEDLSSLQIADIHPASTLKMIEEAGFPTAEREGVWHGETSLLGGGKQEIKLSQVIIAHKNPDGTVAYFSTVARDITAQKKAQAELDELNRQFVAASRQAGMAEVATGVLHNVGNVLNSVSVSATVVGDRLRRSEVRDLSRAAGMMRGKNGQLAQFLTADPKGKLLPEFIIAVSDQLASERDELLAEMNSIGQHIEHIKEIVAMQQNYAKVYGVNETIAPKLLVEDALRMNTGAFERHGVKVVREYEENTPPMCVDRHKSLQILINLIRNAKYAMDAQEPEEKRLTIRVGTGAPGMVRIRVCDNGVGIAPENMTRIFQHGFTTKKDGHGFGLHSGALAAKEMSGSLAAHSDGPGKGAAFTLELPAANHANGGKTT